VFANGRGGDRDISRIFDLTKACVAADDALKITGTISPVRGLAFRHHYLKMPSSILLPTTLRRRPQITTIQWWPTTPITNRPTPRLRKTRLTQSTKQHILTALCTSGHCHGLGLGGFESTTFAIGYDLYGCITWCEMKMQAFE